MRSARPGSAGAKQASSQGAAAPDAALHRPTGIERDVRPDAEFHCLACSSRLTGRSCKIRCPRCGYFEDCSNLL